MSTLENSWRKSDLTSDPKMGVYICHCGTSIAGVIDVEVLRAYPKSVCDVAKRSIESGKIDERVLNDIEVVVRAYDPCLSCSTHLSDQTNLEVAILNEHGKLLKVLTG